MDDDSQQEIIQSRRQDELEALQAFYGHQLRSSLPSSSDNIISPHHNHRGGGDETNDEISLNGPWFIELLDNSTEADDASNSHYCNKIPTLEIRLPPTYPLGSRSSSSSSSCPTPILHNIDHHHLNNHLLSSTQQQQELMEELMEMYEPDMDIAILWAERCRQEFLDVDFGSSMMSSAAAAGSEIMTTTAAATAAAAASDAGANDSNDAFTGNDEKSQHENQTAPTSMSSPSIRFLTFNHLLYGKSHKKEAQIVSLASKLGHIGFVVYGTPGIIGLLVMTNSTNNNGGGYGGEEEVSDFAKECNRIGKRAEVLDFELKFASDGGELLSSFDKGIRNGNNDDDDDGGKKNQSSSKSKKSKKGKGNGNDKNKGNNSSSSGSTGGSSTPLLVNLLGADRVTTATTTNGAVSTIIANMKSGLRHFDSLAESKEVLPGDVVQNILGL